MTSGHAANGSRATVGGEGFRDLNRHMLRVLHDLKHHGPGYFDNLRISEGLVSFGYARKTGTGSEYRPHFEITEYGLEYLDHAGTCRPKTERS